MAKIKKYSNIIQKFLQSEKGRWFFNIAYSLGAAIVIWGALFSILHLRGGNIILCIGMGTEIIIFILSAFDRPQKEFSMEELQPALSSESSYEATENGLYSLPMQEIPHLKEKESDVKRINPSPAIPENIEELRNLAELPEITNNFMALMKNMTEKMSDLNRNLDGLNTIYEIQLKNVSGQLETINSVNQGLKDIKDMFEKSAHEASRYCEETEKMTQYMRQINAVYEKMITAMSINMKSPSNPFISD